MWLKFSFFGNFLLHFYFENKFSLVFILVVLPTHENKNQRIFSAFTVIIHINIPTNMSYCLHAHFIAPQLSQANFDFILLYLHLLLYADRTDTKGYYTNLLTFSYGINAGHCPFCQTD